VVAWAALGRPVAATRSCDGGVEAQPRIDRAAAAWYDVLEVMVARYTSGSVDTHLLPLVGGGDRDCLLPWAIGVGADSLAKHRWWRS
jgi:hypothetical protein